jgi:aminoglycoside phosphotransferase (APT) family kinase protein
VLRRYGPWWQERGEVVIEREFTGLRLALGAGLPVPEPLWRDEARLFAEPAVVLSFVADATPLLTPEDPLDWAEQLAGFLAALHAVEVDAKGEHALRDLNAAIARSTRDAEPAASIAQHRLGRALWDRLRAELRAVDLPDPVFVHNDFWPGNMLWRGQRLAAVVDWEDCGLGDPTLDVAYCAIDMRWQGQGAAADRLLSAYREQTGRDLATLRLWSLVALSRPMPDIARWMPGWQRMGLPDLSADEVRARHAALIERELG